MEDEKNKKADNAPGNIEEVMRERSRIDQLIQEKFRKKMAILFSDICGFTNFTEKRGDIASRSWVQKHHDIVLPIIEEHEGKILDIMGDGVLAAFPETISAVQGSMAIQKALAEHNKKTDPADEIHVSMGINTGEILTDGENVAGDVVNTASRIESEAVADQILISKTAYEDVGSSEDVLCRLHGSVSVKGKSKPLELYRVVWQDEDIVLSKEPKVRADIAAPERKVRAPLKTLQVDVTREEERLKISVSEQSAGEVSTIRHYEELSVSMDLIRSRCNEIINTLNNANRKGSLTRDVLMRLREIGQVFRDELFTLTVKEKIKETGADHLILNLDDQLVHVPWELLHDGKQFLCQKFNMGRLVRTRQTLTSTKTRHLARPLKMLLLADPKGDLNGAYEEGKQIRDFMDKEKEIINAALRSDGVGVGFIKEKIRNFDMVHFAGHAEFNADDPGEGGWKLTDGLLKAKEISKMAGTGAMPALIFSNACQSARTEEWTIKKNFQDEIFGLANAFILSGVKHYIGTFWEILDEPSRLFALEFYKQIISGATIGEATRLSRMELIDKYGEETIIWASYLLYGDPTFNYMDHISAIVYEEEAKKDIKPADTSHEVRAGEDTLQFSGEVHDKPKKKWLWAVGSIIIIIALLLIGYFKFYPEQEGMSEIEKNLLALYESGDYEKARETSSSLMEEDPNLRLSYVILGNIYLMEGDLKTAESFYKKGISASKGTADQKAEAFMGLGRIASVNGNTTDAMKHYKESSGLDPKNGQAYAYQAMLFKKLGEYEKAVDLFNKAGEFSSIDPGYMTLARETKELASYKKDKERQERIDSLVEDLVENMKTARPAVPGDSWTSRPLTMWIMDFETLGSGYSLQEGKEEIIRLCIKENLKNNSRTRIVERNMMDKILEELKLSSSKLVGQSTALELGRLKAARVILEGKVFYSGPSTIVSTSIIETQTGEVIDSKTEKYNSGMTSFEIAEKLAAIWAEKLNTYYPLRGLISAVNGETITINIGQNQGVQRGQQFRVKDSDFLIEIENLQSKSCSGKLVEGEGTLIEGLLVEQI
ncbi:CHAT domain-containing protein [Thermodesulfobacteriota bacterium]